MTFRAVSVCPFTGSAGGIGSSQEKLDAGEASGLASAKPPASESFREGIFASVAPRRLEPPAADVFGPGRDRSVGSIAGGSGFSASSSAGPLGAIVLASRAGGGSAKESAST